MQSYDSLWGCYFCSIISARVLPWLMALVLAASPRPMGSRTKTQRGRAVALIDGRSQIPLLYNKRKVGNQRIKTKKKKLFDWGGFLSLRLLIREKLSNLKTHRSLNSCKPRGARRDRSTTTIRKKGNPFLLDLLKKVKAT
jgi:hypothetical protein